MKNGRTCAQPEACARESRKAAAGPEALEFGSEAAEDKPLEASPAVSAGPANQALGAAVPGVPKAGCAVVSWCRGVVVPSCRRASLA